jgi:hypothetical protein
LELSLGGKEVVVWDQFEDIQSNPRWGTSNAQPGSGYVTLDPGAEGDSYIYSGPFVAGQTIFLNFVPLTAELEFEAMVSAGQMQTDLFRSVSVHRKLIDGIDLFEDVWKGTQLTEWELSTFQASENGNIAAIDIADGGFAVCAGILYGSGKCAFMQPGAVFTQPGYQQWNFAFHVFHGSARVEDFVVLQTNP